MEERDAIKTKLKLKTLCLLTAAFLVMGLVFGGWTGIADAKTTSSPKAEKVFVYAVNGQGKSVLLKVISLEELKKLTHGQLSGLTYGSDAGINYYISSIDNYPATQYCEARGFTIPEFLKYVKGRTTVKGADTLNFSGGDIVRFMATDSYGSYSRSWTYDKLYGEHRYYFKDLYSKNIGWNSGWEIAGEENSKFGLDLPTYNAQYKNKDPFYSNKRAVFAGGSASTVILATDSFSGRTASSSLLSSSETGIADYIVSNGGIAAGSLSKALSDDWALRLCIPMTEDDLMAGHRTAYDNFKWVYNIRLDMVNPPAALVSGGTVSTPAAYISVSRDGKTMYLSLNCATPGASIYYSFDGAPQNLYTGKLSYDITGRELANNPVTLYMSAVKEGCDDAGVVSVKYPQSGVAFQTVYNGLIGKELVFQAAAGVTDADWDSWTKALTGITVKTPEDAALRPLSSGDYFIDRNKKTVAFVKSLFTEAGSYSFTFNSKQYASKTVSLAMKKQAPQVIAGSCRIGNDITLTFSDKGYQNGLSVYITAPGETSSSVISSNYLDRTAEGRVTVKKDYYKLSSCVIKNPGVYTLTLVNNRYLPVSQDIKVTVGK